MPETATQPRILVTDDNTAIHDDFRKIFASGLQSDSALSAAETALFGEPLVQADASTARMRFRIDFASQGPEALAMVGRARTEGAPYAVAFLDVRMPPAWDGIETAARIWAEEPDLQIVICTAYSDYSWTDMLDRLGRSDRLVILKKPFDNIEVLQLASALAEKHRLTSDAKQRMENLESRVKERTQELLDSNSRLAELNRQLLRANEHAKEMTQKAVVAGQAKSEFLANMSHEIRTPMNGILGIAELLADTALSGPQLEYARTILDSSRSLLTVLNDVLDFSKIEAGKMGLEALPVNLRELMANVAGLMSVQAGNKSLRMAMHVADDVPPLVCADPGRLRQILINLCGNSVKFTHTGGIGLHVKAVGHGQRCVTLRFEVRDTGIGIPADRVDALFQPFVQADSSTVRRFGGTGLGLSIVKRLVELMGGEVGVETQEGRGSTFWFIARFELAESPAPVARTPIAATDAAAFEHRASSNLPQRVFAEAPRILLVEDNDVNRMVACRTLEQLGYQVEIAVNGRKAVEAWQRGGHALILMDCQMPVMDGYEATREIRAREPAGTRIPIIALTAHAMQDDSLKCRQAGMDDYLTKPIIRQILSDCLERHLLSAAALRVRESLQ